MKKNLLLIVFVALMSIAAKAQDNNALNITVKGAFFTNPTDVLFAERMITDLIYEAWVKIPEADSIVDYSAVIDARIGTGNSKSLIFKTPVDDLTASFEYHGAWGYAAEAGENVITEGEWHHIAMVISSVDAKASFYIDGVLSGERAQGSGDSDYGNIGAEVNWGDGVIVGSSNWMVERTVLGTIDEIRVWNTARTAQEIADNMNVEADPVDPDLIAYYPCNEDVVSTTLTDASGNGYDLALNADADPAGYSFVEADWEPVSINKNTVTNISVFPNPVVDKINFRGLDLTNAEVRIFDITGQMVKETIANSSTINVAELENGMYLIEIEQGTNNYNGKFVKK